MKKLCVLFLLIMLCGCKNIIVNTPDNNLQCFNGHVYYANIRLGGYVIVTPIFDDEDKLIPCVKKGNLCEFDRSKLNYHWGNIK